MIRDTDHAPWRRSLSCLVLLVSVGLVWAAPAHGQTPDDEQLERAVLAYEDGDVVTARATLDSVTVEPLSDRDASIYHLYSGLVGMVFGQDDDARTHFRLSVRIDPDVQPSPTLVAPGRLQVYREVRKKVLESRVRSLRLWPDSARLTAGDSVKLHVSGTRGDGSSVTSPDATVEVAPDSVAHVTSYGWLRALPDAPTSRVRIIARGEGVADTSTFTVERREPSVAAVRVRPGSARLETGEAISLEGEILDRRGEPIDDAEVSWTSDRTGVARVSAGRLTAVSPGTAEITATAEGESATMEVEVIPALTDLSVQPSKVSLELGARDTLYATPIGRQGQVLERTVSVSWDSEDPSIASVTEEGEVRSLSSGRTTIVARSDTLVERVQVRVREAGGIGGFGAFATGLLFPGLGNYLAGQPGVGVPVTLLSGGAATVGLLSTRTREFCAARVSADCPPGETLQTEEEKHLLVPGLAVAGGVAFVGAVTAAIGAGGDGGGSVQTAVRISESVEVPLSASVRRKRVRMTLLQVHLGQER